jgi:hypothetical protein
MRRVIANTRITINANGDPPSLNKATAWRGNGRGVTWLVGYLVSLGNSKQQEAGEFILRSTLKHKISADRLINRLTNELRVVGTRVHVPSTAQDTMPTYPALH